MDNLVIEAVASPEVRQEEEGTSTEAQISSVQDNQNHCLICCKLVGDIGVESIDSNSLNSVESPVIKKEKDEFLISSDDLFRSLLKLFDVKLNKKTMLRGGSGSSSEKGLENEEQLPFFCCLCKEQLEMLYEVNRKLKELEKALHLGTIRLKELMTTSEVQFQEEQIYDRNERYYHIRSKVLGTSVTGRRRLHQKLEPEDAAVSEEDVKITPPDVEGRVRRSTRRRPKNFYSSLEEDENLDNKFTNEDMDVEHIKVEVDLNFDEENFEDGEGQEEEDINSDSDESFSPEAVIASEDDEDGFESENSELAFHFPEKLAIRKTTKKRKSECVGGSKSGDSNKGTAKKKQKAKSKDEQGEDRKRRRGSYIKARLKEDPRTGNCEYLDIKFDKLAVDKYRCTQCLEIVTNFSTIKKHTVRVHTDRFVCTICGQHKASGSDLNKHIREVHEGKTRKPPEKNMECPICGKPFGHKTALEFHKVTHYSEEDKKEAAARGEKIVDYKDRVKLHQCGICGVVFNNITWLKKHEKIKHPKTEEEKHEVQKICPDCGKSFSEAYLKAHVERYHSNLDDSIVKPFVCSFCDKRFYSSTRLIQHKRTHTGEKPFKCNICDKHFISKNRLKYHNMQNHENKKPFACTNCSAAFVTSYKLRRHVATVHEGKSQKDWNTKNDQEGKTIMHSNSQDLSSDHFSGMEHGSHSSGYYH